MKKLALSLLVASSLVFPAAYAADKPDKAQNESMTTETNTTKMMETDADKPMRHKKKHHRGKKHHKRHHAKKHHHSQSQEACGNGSACCN